MKIRRENFVIRFFTTDIVRKVLALVLACLLYLTVSQKNGTRQEVSGVVVNLDLPPGKLLVGSLPTVSLEVSYNKNLRGMVHPSEIRGHVVIRSNQCSSEDNSVTIPLNKLNFRTPLGVSISKLESTELILKVEDLVSRDVPVVPRYKGKLPSDYRIKKVAFVPGKVQVSGPKSMVNQMTGVSTSEIPITGSTYTFDYRTRLKVESGLRVVPDHVTATIEVEKNRGVRTFPGIPLALLNASGKYQVEFLTSPNIEVKIAGPKGILDTLQKDRIHGFCDVSGLKEPGIQTVDTGCFLDHANGLEILSIYPDKVKIKISR